MEVIPKRKSALVLFINFAGQKMNLQLLFLRSEVTKDCELKSLKVFGQQVISNNCYAVIFSNGRSEFYSSIVKIKYNTKKYLGVST